MVISAWLIERTSLRGLKERAPTIEIESHAELLELDPARWHWQCVADRLSDPDEVLAPLAALIERLAVSEIATKFYSFSSHEWLCFSASSHYPWVNEGLPAIARMDSGSFVIRIPGAPDCVLALEPAVQRIEAALASSPAVPFFGTADTLTLRLFTEELKRQGSELCPQLVREKSWHSVVVADRNGRRRCVLSARGNHHCVQVIEAERKVDTTWNTLDEAVHTVRRFCEDGAPFDEVAVTRTAPAGPRG